MSKQDLMNKVKPILEKGKPINDIIFMSKKMGIFDIAFTLQILRPERRSRFLDRKADNEYGWPSKQIYDMAENPVLTGGGDGLEQLVFGCAAALDVYTEDEIMTVLEAQREYRSASNE